MSLSKEPVYSNLKNHFVSGYRNIMGESYAGNSGTHNPRGQAVDTTNGAGPHNIQLFIMNPDGTVVHCLPGFWNSQDLSQELEFARKLNAVYENRYLSGAEKSNQCKNLQLAHARHHSQDMIGRSQLQHFDMKAEAHKQHSDAIKNPSLLEGEDWGPEQYAAFKTTDQIMHERMAKRPFIKYADFDVAAFADYGTDSYDKHEDSLDETGHVEEGTKVQWIKNHKSVMAARKVSPLSSGLPQPHASVEAKARRQTAKTVYVRTYR